MKEKVIELLKKYSRHKYIELTSRGNTAIFAALYCARKIKGLGKVLIPDQGGWLTYPKYPKMLQMEVVKLKTDKGIIDIDDLKEKVKEGSMNPAWVGLRRRIRLPLAPVAGVEEGSCQQECTDYKKDDSQHQQGSHSADGELRRPLLKSSGKLNV